MAEENKVFRFPTRRAKTFYHVCPTIPVAEANTPAIAVFTIVGFSHAPTQCAGKALVLVAVVIKIDIQRKYGK